MNRHYATTTDSPMGATRVSRTVLDNLWIGAVELQVREDMAREAYDAILSDLMSTSAETGSASIVLCLFGALLAFILVALPSLVSAIAGISAATGSLR